MMKRLLTYGALCLCCVGTTALWAETHTVKFFINGVNFHTDITIVNYYIIEEASTDIECLPPLYLTVAYP